jgi:transposase
VTLEIIKGIKILNEIGQEFGVHPVHVGKWKKELQEQVPSLLDAKRNPKSVDSAADPEKLSSEIGRFKVELDWKKNKSGRAIPMSMRKWWVSNKKPLPVAKQCVLASVNRSTLYFVFYRFVSRCRRAALS